MQGEEFRQLMANPEALGAMMQIQQGMMRLQAASPGTLGQAGYDYIYIYMSREMVVVMWFVCCRLGMGGAPQQSPGGGGAGTSGGGGTPGTNSGSGAGGGGAGVGGAPGTSGGGQLTQDMLQQVLSQISQSPQNTGGQNTGGPPQQPVTGMATLTSTLL